MDRRRSDTDAPDRRAGRVGRARRRLLGVVLGLLVALPGLATARPSAPDLLCATYPDSPLCATGTVACNTCHVPQGPPARNDYGADVRAALADGEDFDDALAEALYLVEPLDSDGDGVDNLAEIARGTHPGLDSTAEPECSPQVVTDNPWYRVGEYDPAFALKRVVLDFCGRSPRYEERAAFAEHPDPVARVSEVLDLCLQSPHWQEVQREMAIGVVRPVGPSTDLSILGNWEWDVRLFMYATSGDRDAADLLTADYFVVEDPPLSGRLVAIDEPRDDTEAYAQPLGAEDRFGLVTTRYSLSMRVMFAPVPRTLAAHYYRELLGLDLARSEGLYPIDELAGLYDWPAPADVDDKGVWQEECAGCHSTLEAMSYPWIRYNGIDLTGGTTAIVVEDRAIDLVPTTDGHLFGEPVSGPEEWVAAAVTSDDFAKRITSLYWRYLFRRDPLSCEQDEYDALWQDFRDDGRNVEAFLRALVLTDAWGTP